MLLEELTGGRVNFIESKWLELKTHFNDGKLTESNRLCEAISVDGEVVAMYNRVNGSIVFEVEDLDALPSGVKTSINEARRVWSRVGDTVVRKFRCTSGLRKGRIVSDPATCHKPIDIKKRVTMKRNQATKGRTMSRKAKRTKRINPASKRVARLNDREN
tara:strand:- start:155334 stop:155813 length:480 start_codon:yes stop_codon:yes gene_type:complete